MKLRIKGNSIRLRLSQSDVAELAASGEFEERTEFAEANPLFIYSIASDAGAETVSARFDNGRISVVVPQQTAEKWWRSDETSIAAEQDLPSGKTLRILIEKDFACLTPRAGEDESDSFPHPRSDKNC